MLDADAHKMAILRTDPRPGDELDVHRVPDIPAIGGHS